MSESRSEKLLETRVGDNVLVWTLGGDGIETSYGANCAAVIGGEAVLLVDPLIAPRHARLVEEALRGVTERPIRFVVLTHHHTDHALGAGWFAARGVEVLAHRRCREAMAAEHPALVEARRRMPALAELFADAEPYLPAPGFEGEIALDLGGTKARVFHPGHGHTAGDAVVALEKESVVLCGDLVSARYHVNYEDAAVASLEGGLEQLRSLGARTYVPGHGAPGGPELLDEQLCYHRAVARAADAGEIRSRFPDYRLEQVVPASVGVWRTRGAS